MDPANGTPVVGRSGFLYTPNQPIVTFPSAYVYGLNDRGQVLLLSVTTMCSGCNLNTNTLLYTPGQGLNFVFGYSAYGAGLNNRGEVIGIHAADVPQPAAVFWSAGTAEIDLQTLLPPNSGYLVFSAQAINNNGQILLWVYLSGGGVTSIIVSPPGSAAAERPQYSGARAAPAGCKELRLNARAAC